MIEQNTSDNAPWYIDIDLTWYIETYPKVYYQAVELANHIREFLDYDDTDRTAFAEEFAKKLGMSQRTLYRYSQNYLEASAWALKLSKMTEQNYDFFKVLSLCRKPKDKNNFPSMSEEIKIFVKGVWMNPNFAANQGTVEMLYSKLEEFAQSNGLEYPSYPTICRYVDYLMNTKMLKNAHYLAGNGLKEYKNKVMVKRSRDIQSLSVLEMVQGDEHTFDCWVAYKHPNGKVTAVRPKLVAWIDTRSKVIMGDVMCQHANSQILKQSLLKVIYGPIGGVPKYILIDNGRDYKSETMTGVKRSEWKNAHSELKFDEETKGFYRGIGISDTIHSKPYQPWSKAQMERFFGTVSSKFTKWLDSYVGTLTGSKTSGKIKKDVNGMLERGELLTLEEFYEVWSKWLSEQYHKSVHSTLKAAKEKYQTPYDLFMNCEDKYYKPAPPKSYAAILMMKSENVLVRNIGIKKFGQEYSSEELNKYLGQKVSIKYDPDDITRLYVYSLEGVKLCEAYAQELLRFAPRVTQDALTKHMEAQNSQIKSDRLEINQSEAEFKELIEQYNNYTEGTAGFDQLTILNKPSKSNKVLALPQSKAYKSELQDKKKKQQAEIENDYLLKQSDKALQVLRNLG